MDALSSEKEGRQDRYPMLDLRQKAGGLRHLIAATASAPQPIRQWMA